MLIVPRATPRGSARGALFGAILIGGGSRRMGRPKHLLDWGGETLVERTARLLDAIVPEVVLVGGGDLPSSLRSRQRIFDIQDLRGPAAGIVAALRSRPGAGALVVACDQPLLSGRLLRWLVERRAAAVVAVQPRTAEERVEPFPAIYEEEALESLLRLGGEGGAGASLQRLAALAPVATPLVPLELANELRGANSPAEVAELLAIEELASSSIKGRGA